MFTYESKSHYTTKVLFNELTAYKINFHSNTFLNLISLPDYPIDLCQSISI